MKSIMQKSLLILTLILLLSSVVFVFSKRMEKFESMPVIKYFYLDTCGWCKKFNPEWEKFEKMVKDNKVSVVVQKLNAAENEKEVDKENIQGFPHVHLINNGKRIDFEEDRTAEELMKFVKKNL